MISNGSGKHIYTIQGQQSTSTHATLRRSPSSTPSLAHATRSPATATSATSARRVSPANCGQPNLECKNCRAAGRNNDPCLRHKPRPHFHWLTKKNLKINYSYLLYCTEWQCAFLEKPESVESTFPYLKATLAPIPKKNLITLFSPLNVFARQTQQLWLPYRMTLACKYIYSKKNIKSN